MEIGSCGIDSNLLAWRVVVRQAVVQELFYVKKDLFFAEAYQLLYRLEEVGMARLTDDRQGSRNRNIDETTADAPRPDEQGISNRPDDEDIEAFEDGDDEEDEEDDEEEVESEKQAID